MNVRQGIQNALGKMVKADAVESGYGDDFASIGRYLESMANVEARCRYKPSVLDRQITTWRALGYISEAKTIIFSLEQVRVFSEIRKAPGDAVNYRLPFDSVFIQFSRPYRRKCHDVDDVESDILGMCLMQKRVDRKEYERLKAEEPPDDDRVAPVVFLPGQDIYWNSLFVFAQQRQGTGLYVASWQSDVEHHEITNGPGGDDFYRDLAVACIGYINCENVYLEKQGEVPEAVNRKREAKGKSRLEPYYVCRIKGVQYDSHATGEGAKHGIRYDVRGHFRRLDTGKTIWVRSHQRGLANELYVPKVYKVEKGSKPAFSKEVPNA